MYKKISSQLILLFTILFFPLTATSQGTYWEQYKGDCEPTLQYPDRYNLDEVRECVITWERYRKVAGLSVDEKSSYAKGMSRLFYEGDETDKMLATAALDRMGIGEPHPLKDNKVVEKPLSTTRHVEKTAPEDIGEIQRLREAHKRKPRIALRPVNAKKVSASKSFNRSGMSLYKKKLYSKAIHDFELALEQNPFNMTAKYNLICNLALSADVDSLNSSLYHLDELSRWEGDDIYHDLKEQMRHARTDEDLILLRNEPLFKILTGYMEIEVLNGTGSIGLEKVKQIKSQIEGMKYKVNKFGNDRYVRHYPIIYFRPGFEEEVQIMKKILNSAKTKERKIHWDTIYDMVIVWGDPQAEAEESTVVLKPEYHGTPTDAEKTDPFGKGMETLEKGKEKVDKVKDAEKIFTPLPE